MKKTLLVLAGIFCTGFIGFGQDAVLCPNSNNDGAGNIPIQEVSVKSHPSMSPASNPVFQMPATVNGTSQNSRAPSNYWKYQRTEYLLTASEIAASGLPSGSVLSSIGFWVSAAGVGSLSNGTLSVWLMNTTATAYGLGTTWTISGFTNVATIPNYSPVIAAGTYDIPFSGGAPFTYSGAGLYVAWEYSSPTGTIGTTPVTHNCNQSLINGLVGGRSATAPPTSLTYSNYRPITRLGTSSYEDVFEVTNIYVQEKCPLSYGMPTNLSARVTNLSSVPQTFNVNITITDQLTAMVRHTDIQPVVNLAAGASTIVNFTPWYALLEEDDYVTVDIPPGPGENWLSNNTKTIPMNVNTNLFSYCYFQTVSNGYGFTYNGAGGIFAAKFHMNGGGTVTGANLFIYNYSANVGNMIYAVVLNSAGSVVATSTSLIISSGDLGTNKNFVFDIPPGFYNEDFYVGLAQPTGGTVQWYPMAVQSEVPIRANTYYYFGIGGGSPTIAGIDNKYMIEAQVGPPPPVINPLIFSASAVSTSEIDLSWVLNPNGNNVLLAWSPSGTFGTPIDGTTYNPGDPIPGGGTVLQYNASTSFPHVGLTPATEYFYKAWSYDGGYYSSGVTASAFTKCLPVILPLFEPIEPTTSTMICWQNSSQVMAGGIWEVSPTDNAGGNPDEMKATWVSGTGVSRLISPPLNTIGFTLLHLSFNQFFDDYGAGITYKIQSSADGINWTDESWSRASGNGNTGPEVVNTTVINNLGATTYIAWVLDGDHYQFDYWFIDNINITGSNEVQLNAGDDLYQVPHALIGFGTDLPIIPPGFFGPGSDPFEGVICLQGGPSVGGSETEPDTRVRRLETRVLQAPPAWDQIPIEIVSLNLVSVNPIRITYPGNVESFFDVTCSLSGNPAPASHSTVMLEDLHGGTFSSVFYVQPVFTFTNVANPLEVYTFPSPGLYPLEFYSHSTSEWTLSPIAGEFDPINEDDMYFGTTTGGYIAMVPYLERDGNTFSISMNETGTPESWSGNSYNGGQWYYYPNFDWWNIWFYDHPIRGFRSKYIKTAVMTISPRNITFPSNIEIVYNYSTPSWPTWYITPHPPLPSDVTDPLLEQDYIDRSMTLFQYSGFINQPISVPLITPYHIPDYNPEWLSVDIRGYNFNLSGNLKHVCFRPWPRNLDFGDAPDPTYPTVLASNGARHVIVQPIRMGVMIDGEVDGQPSIFAIGDDITFTDDEDGVVFNTGLTPGQPASLTVSASLAKLFLQGWIDYNGDGDWADPGEQIITNYVTSLGANVISFIVPPDAAIGQTFARFRLSSVFGLSYYGPAPNGEVEDYMVEILSSTKSLNLKLLLQGLYAGGGMMNKAQDEFGDHFPGDIADVVTVELHNAANYSIIEYTATNIAMQTNGTVNVAGIPAIHNGNYYLTVKHRNSIETTSASPVSFASGFITYDFTSSPLMAYGGNQILFPDGFCAIFGGDVSQDGLVDSSDMIDIDNDASNFVMGYIVTDVNGDGLVDSSDMILVDNNANTFVASVLP